MIWLMEFIDANAVDLINGTFQLAGGSFILISVFKLHREKLVRGVSWLHVSFFTTWGGWNLYFYPYLDQWFSFAGGLFIVVANGIWLGQMLYWNSKERE